jgi:hypothetical protein
LNALLDARESNSDVFPSFQAIYVRYYEKLQLQLVKELKNVEKHNPPKLQNTLLIYPQKVIMKIYHQKRNYK